ncbi:MAG: signal peptidase I [Lachnospiraceae bacterium]|nr:signal peptidase I [Lachnospiraceae bacterium]
MKSWVKEIIDWVLVIGVALAVALFLNNFIITNSFIPTGSMETNLPIGARVFGFRLQYLFSKPQRGDVVIFDYGFICKNKDCKLMYQKNDEGVCPNCKRESSKNKKAYYIKRVIGLPGEHIEIKADYPCEVGLIKGARVGSDTGTVPCGHVYVNAKVLEEDYINGPMIVSGDRFKSMDIVVPDGHYFLLGDNRNNSEDARFWPKTFVPLEDIKAKAWILYWPLTRLSIIK